MYFLSVDNNYAPRKAAPDVLDGFRGFRPAPPKLFVNKQQARKQVQAPGLTPAANDNLPVVTLSEINYGTGAFMVCSVRTWHLVEVCPPVMPVGRKALSLKTEGWSVDINLRQC